MTDVPFLVTWILWSCVHMVDVEGDTAKAKIFNCGGYDAATGEWKDDSVFEKGNKATLKCLILGKEGRDKCAIYRLENNTTKKLNYTYDKDTSLLIHELDTVECWMTDTYMCSCGNDDDHPLESYVGVKKCEPLPCSDDTHLRNVKYVSPKETTSFILQCIKCSSGINETAHLDGSALNVNTLSRDGKWSWTYTNVEFRRSLVEIHLTNVSEQDYGEHHFTLFSNDGVEYKMEYTIELRKAGLPDCPRDVSVTEIGISHVSLKWIPGNGNSDEGQSFLVLHRKANNSWMKASRVKERVATIQNLNENEDHAFRVESSNKYGEANCTEVIHARTEDLPECPKDVSVTERGISHVSLKWTPGNGNCAEGQSFHVLHRKAHASWMMVLPTNESTVTENNVIKKCVTIKNLNENYDHSFRVVSSNKYGEANCTEVTHARTKGPINSGGDSLVERLSFAVILFTAGLWWSSLRLILGHDWREIGKSPGG